MYFKEYLLNKGRKATTVRTYDEALKSLHKIFPGLLDVTVEDIVTIKDALMVSESSKRLYLIVLGRFLECFGRPNTVKESDILWNRTEPRRLFIRPEDFKSMMASCTLRERVVLMMGAYLGLRRSEMCSSEWKDLRGNILTVRGKGHGQGKEAHLTVPRPLMMVLEQWRDVSKGETILTNTKGERMTSEGVGRMVARLSKEHGVPMTPHSLRRLFATTLYETGADLNTIRVLMRHESVNTTVNCYINVNPIIRNGALDALCTALG